MKREIPMTRELTFALAMSSMLIAASLAGQTAGFQPKCLPFNETGARQPFDDQCNEGKTKDPGTIVQDGVKDNFCVTGTPVTVDVPTLVKLQADVEAPSVLGLKYTPPRDRSALHTLPTKAPDGSPLGEGRLVQMVMFVFEAHYSDVKSGESVNCKIPGAPNNDIHVALVSKPDETDECQSVTTEITPHYRPTVWTDAALNSLKGTPIRITGQLFFDASHHPRVNGTCPDPKRVSSWEIHPLYKLEVCTKTSLVECKATDTTPGLWLSMSELQKKKGAGTVNGGGNARATRTPGSGAASPGQAQWEATLAEATKEGDDTASVRYKGEIRTLKVDGNTAGALAKFSPGDTVWLRVGTDHASITKVECVPVPVGERIWALVLPAAFLILLTVGLSWGGALNFLMGTDGHYSKSKFQLAIWFGVLVTVYVATYCLRWRYVHTLGDIGMPAHLALLSGFSAFTFAAAKRIAVNKNQPAAPGDAAAPAAPAAPPQPVAPPGGLAVRSTFLGDLLTDDAGNAEVGDYQMLVIILLAVVTYLFQAYHFLGTMPFGNVKLPDVDSTILATFGLGQSAYLGNKAAKPKTSG
jgi:hypothetical protein